MEEFISNYSLSDIAIFIVLLAIAIKSLVTFLDWAKDRLRRYFDKETKEEQVDEKLFNEINEVKSETESITGVLEKEREEREKELLELKDTVNTIRDAVNMLIDSDRKSIKAYITSQHHSFVYQYGWIDDYSMNCIEKRYMIYEKEHGNSFVRGLMNELRKLPKVPPEDFEGINEKIAHTAECVKRSHEYTEP